MARRPFSNAVGFDDAPFRRGHSGPLPVVGAVFAGPRFEGLLLGELTKDGTDAADVLASLVNGSRFAAHIQLILLQGITMGGFNVIDAFQLHESTGKPVIAITRSRPDSEAFKNALLQKIPGGEEKWRAVERLGPAEPVGTVFIQRVGVDLDDASAAIRHLTINGRIPEPIRTAHIIAGALAGSESRSRV